jgi:hypothetical protein
MGVFLDDRKLGGTKISSWNQTKYLRIWYQTGGWQVGLHESKQRCAEDLAVRGALWTEFGWSFLKYFWFQECHHFTPT